MNARETALQVLIDCRAGGAWADAALKAQIERSRLSPADAALCSRLVYGVIQNRMLLDYRLAAFCTQDLAHLQPPLREILRLGACQLLLMDKVPDHAAVGETVALAKKMRPQAAGLVNAVLRRLAQNRAALPELPARDAAQYLSIRFSHPKWLVRRLLTLLGREETEAFLAENNAVAPLTVQVNPLKTTAEELERELEADGVQARRHPWVPGCLELTNPGNPARLRAFQEGKFLIQDPAARLVPLLAQLRPGMSVLDVCAAPGGKSFGAAFDMADQGRVVACDLHEKKLGRIQEGARRLGLHGIETYARDGRDFCEEWAGRFDAVLVDAPCSGFGIIRKKPDIRYKKADDLFTLSVVQAAILDRAARYVAPGGVLLYSTCTILPEENEQVTQVFLAEHGDFSLSPFTLPGPVGETDGTLTLWPQRHGTDGFYICRMRRRE